MVSLLRWSIYTAVLKCDELVYQVVEQHSFGEVVSYMGCPHRFHNLHGHIYRYILYLTLSSLVHFPAIRSASPRSSRAPLITALKEAAASMVEKYIDSKPLHT